MGSSDWYIILLSNTGVNCHRYTEVRRMTENVLVGKAACIGELYLGRSEILRSLRYYVWAHSQGHPIDCNTHTSYMQSVGCLWLCSHTEYLKVLRIHMQARTHIHTHNTRMHTYTHTIICNWCHVLGVVPTHSISKLLRISNLPRYSPPMQVALPTLVSCTIKALVSCTSSVCCNLGSWLGGCFPVSVSAHVLCRSSCLVPAHVQILL